MADGTVLQYGHNQLNQAMKPKKPKCQHRYVPKMNFSQQHDESEAAEKRGEKMQYYCKACDEWIWGSYWRKKP